MLLKRCAKTQKRPYNGRVMMDGSDDSEGCMGVESSRHRAEL